jgi:hypothetical protein
MRKQPKAKGVDNPPTHNPVAKFAHQFNKAQIFADKRKYQRKAKHSGLEPFSITLSKVFEKGFNAFAA